MQLEHLLCQGGTKLLQEPNLFCWNLSFFLFMTMLDENKCMWSVDLMPCWMETWFMWCYYFCAGISVSINGLKKWDELVAWIFIWAVYIVLNLISWKLMVGWEIFGPSLWTMLNWAHPQMGRGVDVSHHVSNHVIGHVNLHVIIAIHVIAKSTATSSSMSSMYVLTPFFTCVKEADSCDAIIFVLEFLFR